MIETMTLESLSGELTGMVIESRYAGPDKRDTLHRVLDGNREVTGFMTAKEAVEWCVAQRLTFTPGSRKTVRP